MIPNDPATQDHERLLSRLVAGDDALAAGETPPLSDPELDVDLAFLRQVRQALRPARADSAPDATTAPESSPAVPPGLPWTELGRFRLKQELGRGGMGVVFLAHDPLLGRDVALKVPRAESLADSASRERFQREAQAAAGLEHPNLVPVYETGAIGPICYLVSAYCPGVNLSHWLRQHAEPVPVPAAAGLLEALAAAVQHAHARGVVHRDLKPGNIILQPRHDSPAGDARVPTGLEDYEPRITDFGLAKLVREGAGEPQTRSQTVMGTALYMAPEQAAGKSREVGPAADIYSLGVILYELLTGRPPFRGETEEETIRQVQVDEPLPPSRLRTRMPRDLETICLKCLEKEPHRRYPSAQALADDLHRFLEGRPILARPVGRAERAWRWCKRNPREAVIAALLLTLVLGGAGSAWWLDRQQAERTFQKDQARQRVESVLTQLATLRERFWWDAAEQNLQRAEREAADLGLPELLTQLRKAQQDLRMAARLDQIRLDQSLIVEDKFSTATAVPAYRDAFRDYGLDIGADDERQLIQQVRDSAIREELVASLDNWAWADRDLRRRLLTVARGADPDPWKDRLRDPAVLENVRLLRSLVGEVDVSRLAPAQLCWLGKLLSGQEESLALLRAAQRLHPADFWLDFLLACELHSQGQLDEAVGYYRAALAVRPQNTVAHNNLGTALFNKGLIDQAMASYRDAIRVDPRFVQARHNLGLALERKGLLEEAIAAYREALRLKPNYPEAHYELGRGLAEKGLLDEAIAAFEEAIRLKGDFAKAHYNLGAVLAKKGLWDDALAHFREAIRLMKDYPLAHQGLGSALEKRGLLDEAIAAYQEAIRLDERDPEAHHSLARALDKKGLSDQAVLAFKAAIRLEPNSVKAHQNLGTLLARKGLWDDAIARFREAIRLKEDYPLAHYNLGLTLEKKGLLEEAIAAYREALRLKPNYPEAHCYLGQALQAMGQFADGLDALRRGHEMGSKNPNWSFPSAQWVRYCEHLCELDRRLPAVLRGEAKPQDAVECLGFGEVCRYKKRYAAGARLYADALADPKFAARLPRGQHYAAACTAAQAATGQGEDARTLDDQERARLRQQAHDWLRFELGTWKQALKINEKKLEAPFQRTLRQWQCDPGLTSVRDPEALAQLPEAEQLAWRQFWQDVEKLLDRAQSTGKTGSAPD